MLCEYFSSGFCRSCNLLGLGLDDAALRAHKAELFLEMVGEAGLDDSVCVEPLYSPLSLFDSRAKARLSVSGPVESPVVGLLDKNFHGIELQSCPLHFREINEIVASVSAIISKYSLVPYDVVSRTGELKSIIINSNTARDSQTLRFVVRSTKLLEQLRSAGEEILVSHPTLKSISANIQPIPHQIPEGPEEILLTDDQLVWEKLGDIEMAFKSRSFSQVTPATMLELYRYVASLVPDGARGMLDLYCGLGGFSLFASSKLNWIAGVEISEVSIECAEISAKRNNFKNIEFHSQGVEDYLDNYSKASPDVVIINPPRRGLSESIISQIVGLCSDRVIYSSCNTETLFRDLGSFVDKYKLKILKPFDMFPLTSHFEVVALLTRK